MTHGMLLSVNLLFQPVLTPQQKQQKVKELIAKIPTDRNVLFKYPVDWEKVDEVCFLIILLIFGNNASTVVILIKRTPKQKSA